MASDENSDIFRKNVGDMIIEIEFYSPKAVRISKYYAHPEQVSNAKIDQEHIDQIGKENLEIILDPLKQRELISPTQEEEEDFIIIKTSQLRCIINKKGDKKEDKKGDKKEDKKEIKMGNIRIGKPNDPKADFLSEHQGKMVEHEIESSKKPFTIYQSYKISEEEGLFGLGQQQKKNLNWRGGSVHLDQHNTIISVPVLLSTEGYGIIWENLGESHFEENNNIMSFEATRGEAIRYWVIFGPTFDEIIKEIRTLTGHAPMYPKWGYGFIQSRNRYWTRDEVINVVKKHRQMKLPLDIIVIDYIYYGKHGVGSHIFDEDNFPNPEEMINEFHNIHNCKLLLSIWPTFSKNADTYDIMKEKGFILDCNALGGWFYDPYNPEAGSKFWEILNKRLYSLGVDAWWLDASEPDDEKAFRKIKTYMGDAMDYLNIYSLLHTKHIYQGQMEETPEKRPLLLTRSAFIGQQRNAAAAWSGDVRAKYHALQKQIPSGLNFCVTGLPYWCTDIGGYKGGWAKNPIYRELFIRWFQYGAFCPLFRSHGRRWPMDRKGKNEIWEYGKKATKIIRNITNLRYRLYPYVYTTAWKVWSEDYTMMRMLPFDYPKDPKVYGINDQFLFGPDIMVCPITKFLRRKRDVYLPYGEWYDFWTGDKYDGGKEYKVRAPLSKIPLFVKAGTILTLGPIQQYYNQKDPKDIELRVYPGKNGKTSLYFDDGVSNAYKDKHYCLLFVEWDNSQKKIQIKTDHNDFYPEGTSFNFTVNLVKRKTTSGIEAETEPYKLIEYNL